MLLWESFFLILCRFSLGHVESCEIELSVGEDSRKWDSGLLRNFVLELLEFNVCWEGCRLFF